MTIVAAAAGLALLFPHPVVERHNLGSDWVLTVRKNDFADSVACTLRKRDAEYQRRTVVIRLGRRRNTVGAVYRIDGGPLQRAADDAAMIAQRGFRLDLDDLENPSGGLVRVPAERLLAATAIEIDAEGRDRPVTVRIGGLQSVLGAAERWGCGDDAFQ